jgi:hypothetical protein
MLATFQMWQCRRHVSSIPSPPQFPGAENPGPPLWSSGQSSWLQIQRSGFNSLGYHIFWEVVGLENGVHSASRVQLWGYLEETVAVPVYETENTAMGIPSADHATLYISKICH